MLLEDAAVFTQRELDFIEAMAHGIAKVQQRIQDLALRRFQRHRCSYPSFGLRSCA